MTKLEELEKLEKEATPGPWYQGGFSYNRYVEYEYNNMDGIGPQRSPVVVPNNHDDKQIINVKLQAKSRNALPALLRVARAAKEWNTSFHEDGVAIKYAIPLIEKRAKNLREAIAELEAQDD